jgi:hypothetical protein
MHGSATSSVTCCVYRIRLSVFAEQISSCGPAKTEVSCWLSLCNVCRMSGLHIGICLCTCSYFSLSLSLSLSLSPSLSLSLCIVAAYRSLLQLSGVTPPSFVPIATDDFAFDGYCVNVLSRSARRENGPNASTSPD